MSSYRLDVVSTSVIDAVRYAGGLIFDRARAGWRVVVVTEDATNSTALTILGTKTQPPGQQPEEILGRAGRVIRTQILPGEAVSANPPVAHVSLPRIEPSSQVLFWGPPVSRETTATVYPVRHELSPAARSFKAQALHAIGFDARIEPCEEFWANTVLDPDLMAGLLPALQT